jgi:hypothetical protein
MQTVNIDKDYNIVLKGGELVILTGEQALIQDIRTKIGLCIGENYFDVDEGIDFFNLDVKKIGSDFINELIIERILQCEGVISAYYNRQNKNYIVNTIYGGIEI